MDFSYDCLLLRYGELALKGKNRRNFIDLLLRNTKKALSAFPDLRYDAGYDRMFIYLNGEPIDAVSEIVPMIFGFSSFSKAIKIDSNIETICACALDLVKERKAGTFKIQAHRHDKLFEYSSDQINRMAAAEILKNTDWKVDVHHPDLLIRIEVRKEFTYVMEDKIPGAGGYPVGIEGKAMSLLSGGIDSPVASYLVMRRGVKLEAIHFASPPYTSQQAKEKVEELGRILSKFQGELKVHIIPFTTLQLAIYQHVPESYAITIMRRMMLRIAHRLADKRHCLALASGENLGQVASQTLDSLYVINNVTNLPVLRPVIGFDKVEIIDLARKIGTYDTSILPFEDCCTIFTPKNPVTHPKLEKCIEYESGWDYEEMIKDCLNMAETIVLRPEAREQEEFF